MVVSAADWIALELHIDGLVKDHHDKSRATKQAGDMAAMYRHNAALRALWSVQAKMRELRK